MGETRKSNSRKSYINKSGGIMPTKAENVTIFKTSGGLKIVYREGEEKIEAIQSGQMFAAPLALDWADVSEMSNIANLIRVTRSALSVK
jgi:hypothetical protein